MSYAVGKMQVLKALADKLAPGRAVRRITLDFPVTGVCTAVVEVFLEESDMELVQEAVDEIRPEVIVVEDRRDGPIHPGQFHLAQRRQ